MALTPKQIVEALDTYIIGQAHAKRMVAIALRNRTRRRRLPEEKAREITPKNIILIGATGVGKTEIARRLADLTGSPFVKVEATKYTEVGYVGRDVESMVRDLVDRAMSQVRQERTDEVKLEAEKIAERRLLDLLLPDHYEERSNNRTTSVFPDSREHEITGPGFVVRGVFPDETPEDVESTDDADNRAEIAPDNDPADRRRRSRDKILQQLRDGKLEEREVEVEVSVSPTIGIVGGGGMEEMGMDMRGVLDRMLPRQSHRRMMSVAEARKHLVSESTEEMLDEEAMARDALASASEEGIIFIDEFDKIAGRRGADVGSRGGPDVSREGVQRDILPIVEGSSVKTKYGIVQTEHILFIAAGSFSQAKPSDLIPELQGRFPLRSELKNLTTEDFQRILTEPRSSLCAQYSDLLETDGVDLKFTEGGIAEIAEVSTKLNSEMENIGARRLHTILERILEDIAFDAPDNISGPVTIDNEFVRGKISDLMTDQDPEKFIL